MLVYFVTTARPAKDTAALYLDSVGFWYTKLISSSIFIASSGSFVQAIITAGRTGFGSPGQVMAAKNGPVGPKFTPDRIFRDRHPIIQHSGVLYYLFNARQTSC